MSEAIFWQSEYDSNLQNRPLNSQKKKESTSQSSRMIRMAMTSGSGIFLENLMTVKAPESRY
jgi:hypothetical protein